MTIRTGYSILWELWALKIQGAILGLFLMRHILWKRFTTLAAHWNNYLGSFRNYWRLHSTSQGFWYGCLVFCAWLSRYFFSLNVPGDFNEQLMLRATDRTDIDLSLSLSLSLSFCWLTFNSFTLSLLPWIPAEPGHFHHALKELISWTERHTWTLTPDKRHQYAAGPLLKRCWRSSWWSCMLTVCALSLALSL